MSSDPHPRCELSNSHNLAHFWVCRRNLSLFRCGAEIQVRFCFRAEDGIRDYKVTWSSDVCSSDLKSPDSPTSSTTESSASQTLRFPFSTISMIPGRCVKDNLPSGENASSHGVSKRSATTEPRDRKSVV